MMKPLMQKKELYPQIAKIQCQAFIDITDS